jgi:hypothetical protein
MGPPETAQLRATLPTKSPLGAMVIVEVPLGPADAIVTAAPLRVKLGGAAGTLTMKLVVALRLAAELAVTMTV